MGEFILILIGFVGLALTLAAGVTWLSENVTIKHKEEK